MARPRKIIADTEGTEKVVPPSDTDAPAAPQAPETTDAVGGVAAPSAASAEPKWVTVSNDLPETEPVDPEPVLPTHGPAGYVLKVTGPLVGRWRAGRKFGAEPVMIPAPELTQAEWDALCEDPKLVCELIQIAA